MSKATETLNVNETALLGLLSEKARYGYELDKIIEEKMMREWTDIAFSSIYAVLKGLEGKGLVESAAEIAGNRVRRHYAITRKGRKALREAVRKTLSEPIKTEDSLMAGVAYMSVLPEPEARKALEARILALKAQQALVDKTASVARKKDKLYFESLTARASSRIKEDLCFVEGLLEASTETTESKEEPEADAEKDQEKATPKTEPPAPEPTSETLLIRPLNKETQLPKPTKKGSEAPKQTLF